MMGNNINTEEFGLEEGIVDENFNDPYANDFTAIDF